MSRLFALKYENVVGLYSFHIFYFCLELDAESSYYRYQKYMNNLNHGVTFFVGVALNMCPAYTTINIQHAGGNTSSIFRLLQKSIL